MLGPNEESGPLASTSRQPEGIRPPTSVRLSATLPVRDPSDDQIALVYGSIFEWKRVDLRQAVFG